uniref:Uncharacterized protein n=1 Tax=Clytia hemisphaerica TaxID=252671 RepID=A0A7M5UW36_9CNID
MTEEYEREKELQRQKEEEVRKKNEELKMMADKKRFAEEAKQKQIDAEMEQELKRQAQLKLQQQQNQEAVQIARSDSPPIPTVAKQQKRKERERKLSLVSNHTEENEMSPNIQTTTMTNNEMRTTTHTTNHRPDSAITRHQQQPQKQQKQLTSDEEYLNTIRKSIEVQQQINETDVEQQGHVIKQLAHLRSQLQQQERKIKTELQINEAKYSELKSGGKPNANDIFNKATKKNNQSTPTKNEYNPSNYDSSRKYGKELDYEQRKLMRQQEERLNDLRKKIESDKAQMKYSSTTNNKPKYNSRGSAKSLLDSESQFISLRDYQDITDQVLNNNRNPPTFNRKPTTDNSSTKEKNTRYSGATRSTTSARARRREKEKAEMDNIFQEYFPLEKEIDTSSTFDMDRISMRNEERLKKFKQIESNNHNDNETEDNNGDADDIVRKFMNQTTLHANVHDASETSLPSSSKFL